MDRHGLRAKRWPLAIVAFFLVVFGANALLVHLALSHPDPVVDSYEQEAR